MSSIEELIREHEELVDALYSGETDKSAPLDPDDLGALDGSALQSYDPNTMQLILPRDEAERLRRYIWVVANQCMVAQLGYTKMFPPKTKCCPLRCKDWYVHLFVRVCHPAAQELWDDIQVCLRRALGAAGLAALLSGSAAAIATFKLTFYGCMIDKGYNWAKDISLHVYTETRNGPWRKC
jgi:hypothetical protein